MSAILLTGSAGATTQIYTLTLDGAVPGNTPLQVNLPVTDGQGGGGVAVGWNRTGHTVDASGLRVNAGKVTGEIAVTYRFDGYIPTEGKPVTVKYQLTGNESGGEYTSEKVSGQWRGERRPPPNLRGYWLLELHLENGAHTNALSKKSWSDRATLRVLLKDREPVQVLSYGHGGRSQINYFQTRVTAHDLKLTANTLTGSVTLQPVNEPTAYEWRFTGTVAGDLLAGEFTKTVAGKTAPGGPWRGTLQPFPAPAAETALYYLELHGAMPGGAQLFAFVPRRDETFGDGIGYCAAYNKTYHEVNGTGLKLADDQLTGALAIVYLPDPYVPPDKQPAPGRYTLRARVVDGRYVTGTFTGQFRDAKVSGPVYGELVAPPAVPEPVAIHLKLEDGVNDGSPWFRRVFTGFTAVNGQAAAGSFANNKGGWTGKFQRASVQFDGAKFAATIEGVVETTKGPKTGQYKFELTGRVVGQEIVGTVVTFRDGQQTKSGTAFMGAWRAPKSGSQSAQEDE